VVNRVILALRERANRLSTLIARELPVSIQKNDNDYRKFG
jgi:hypothetical protein